MTVVLGWLEAADEHVIESPAVRRAVRMARDRAMHGRSIALRAMGASESLPETAISCESFVRNAAAGVVPQANRRAVRIETHVEGEAGDAGVTASARALQVLTNVLMNAVSFSPEGATVSLAASRADESNLRFTVRDQGPGFEASRSKRVFEGLTSTREGGSGIGLRYAYQIARQHGGSLRLVDPGPGAVFELIWPSTIAQPARAPIPSTIGLEGMRLLVVEDDVAVSMLLETALSAKGASVDTAFDTASLSALLADHLYDAALVDLSPLEPDIVGGLARIRCSQSHPKLVLITGSASSPDQTILDQASAWVRKPFEIGDVVTALLELPR